MRFLARYKRKTLDASHELDAFERFNVGSMTGDGQIWPKNDPLFWKKQSWDCSQQSNAEFYFIPDLQAWLDVPAEEFNHFFLEVSVQFVIGGDEAATDDFIFRFFEGANEEDRCTIADYGAFAATRGGAPGAYPAVCKVYLHPGLTKIAGYFTEWAATEDHLGRVTAVAYRMPDGLCENDGTIQVGP